ncbi:hypothetical protein CBR_g12667 [Chara braunii]|uniref:Uncharacterized protein n=1 Tax=Chara braunii TaxID=69332 RepID=A0A388KSC7_CHABU|nr:hypothetical protein CBR_g12667 [Chara braunii]|eukprot:GBG72947.1 hypothetical protein CBR_g12667 [Chara braunii]
MCYVLYSETTLGILKKARWFHITVPFERETGLKTARQKVNALSILLRDFPTQELWSASEPEEMVEEMERIFGHMRRRAVTMKMMPTDAASDPLVWSVAFVDALSRDLANQLIRELGAKNLMALAFEEFDKDNGQTPGSAMET